MSSETSGPSTPSEERRGQVGVDGTVDGAGHGAALLAGRWAGGWVGGRGWWVAAQDRVFGRALDRTRTPRRRLERRLGLEAQRDHLVEPGDQALVEDLEVGDRPAVGVDPERAGVLVAEQGDVDAGADGRAEGVLHGHLGAADPDRDRYAGHVAGQEVDVPQDRPDVPARQQVEPAGDRLGQRQRRLLRGGSGRTRVSRTRARGSVIETGTWKRIRVIRLPPSASPSARTLIGIVTWSSSTGAACFS